MSEVFMSMFKFTEYVPANQIWPTAEVFVDNGYKPGYVRGYNIEVRKADGTTYWESACWFAEEPEESIKSVNTPLMEAHRLLACVSLES